MKKLLNYLRRRYKKIQFEFKPLNLSENGEIAAKNLLNEHFLPVYGERTPQYVEMLLATEHYLGRFQYLMSVIQCKSFQAQDNILISGCGAGSEMLAARQVGFGNIFGVEVEQIWIDASKLRLQHLKNMHLQYYEGEYLPYDDNQFKIIASGHVIEHTKNPYLYLQECMRVLKLGGYLSLEFPNRYHIKELHTGLVSFEWLPNSIRNSMYRTLSSKFSPINDKAKEGYARIASGNLKQISMTGIKRMLNKIGVNYVVLDSVTAAPGIIRCVIKKQPS